MSLAQIQADLDDLRGRHAAGEIDDETARYREEDLLLGRGLLEQGKEDPDLVVAALDLQKGALEEGARPIPRLLRLLRELKAGDETGPTAVVPAAPPPEPEPVADPAPAEFPGEDFDSDVFRREDRDFFRSRVDEDPPPSAVPALPPAPAPTPAPSKPSTAPRTRTTASKPRTRPMARTAPPPPAKKGSKAWVIVLVLVLVAGLGTGAWFVFRPKPSGPAPVGAAGSPLLEEADRMLADADAARGRSPRTDVAAKYRAALQKYTEAIQASSRNPAAYEGRAAARWRISSELGRPDPEGLADAEEALAQDPARPRAQVLRGLFKLAAGLQQAGGWDPWPSKSLQSVLAVLYPGLLPLVKGPDATPPAFGRIPEAQAEAIRRDLQGAKAEGAWSALASGAAAWLSGATSPVDDPAGEVLLYLVKASRLPTADGRRILEQGLEKLPDSPALVTARGWTYAAEGRFDEAGEAAQKALAAEDGLPSALLLQAASHLGRGKPQLGLDALARLAGRDAEFPLARGLRAVGCIVTGPADRILAELDAVAEELPLPVFRYERSLALLARRQTDAARQELLAASKATPGPGLFRGLVATGLWHAGDLDGAAEELGRIGTTPVPAALAAELNILLALVRSAKGDDDAASASFLKAAQIGDAAVVIPMWVQMLESNRDWKGLGALADELSKRPGATEDTWVQRVKAAWNLGDPELTVRMAGEALAKRVEPAKVLPYRARAHDRAGRLEKALDDWNAALTRKADEVAWQAERAWVLARLGRAEEARTDADVVITRGAAGRSAALAYLVLARVYARRAAEEDEPSGREAQTGRALAAASSAARTGRLEAKDFAPEGDFAIFKDHAEFKRLPDDLAAAKEQAKRAAAGQAFLGVNMDTTKGRVELIGTQKGFGARAAGLVPGDAIVEVDGTSISTIQDFQARLSAKRPGDKVQLRIERQLRPSLRISVLREVTLSARPEFAGEE